MLKRIRAFGKHIEGILASPPEREQFPTRDQLLEEIDAVYRQYEQHQERLENFSTA